MKQKYKTLVDLCTIFSLFTDLKTEELSVSDISRRLGMSPSKVSRMLGTLEDEGFFERNSYTGKYRLGFRLFELGIAYSFHLPLRKIIRPHIENLSIKLGMTASWGIISKGRVIVIDRIQNINIDMLAHRLGFNLPIHSTSIGKVLFAYLSEEEQDQILNSISLIKYTSRTVVDPELIKESSKLIRKNGYAYDQCETAEDLVCIAAPIKDSSGSVIAAINLTDNISRTSMDQLLKNVDLLKERALFISRQLGYEVIGLRNAI